jgi:hypothetical protein
MSWAQAFHDVGMAAATAAIWVAFFWAACR